MKKIIEVNHLKKSFGKINAVNHISFYVEEGSLFAFLGPNGAGKSTTIDMICTLLKLDEGSILIDGFQINEDDQKIRDIIGVVFQDSILDPLLTVRENLLVRGKFYSISRASLQKNIEAAARSAGAFEFLDRPYGKLSGGQRRRADIARALVHTPKILFLDEPTTGLDPQTRSSVWKTITRLRKENGMTIFLTTHYMEEAAMADYITIIDRGEIVAKGTPLSLKQAYTSDLLRIKPSIPEELQEVLDNQRITYTIESGLYHIRLKHSKESLPILQAAEPYIDSFEVIHGTMDEVFIQITGKEIRGL